MSQRHATITIVPFTFRHDRQARRGLSRAASVKAETPPSYDPLNSDAIWHEYGTMQLRSR